jgi:hypothetical protein
VYLQHDDDHALLRRHQGSCHRRREGHSLLRDTEPAKGQRDYRIDVTLPKEKNTRDQSTVIVDGCGVGLPTPTPSNEEHDWEEYTFTLEGHLDRPVDKNLVGSCDKMVKDHDVGSDHIEAGHDCNRFKNMGNAEHPG